MLGKLIMSFPLQKQGQDIYEQHLLRAQAVCPSIYWGRISPQSAIQGEVVTGSCRLAQAQQLRKFVLEHCGGIAFNPSNHRNIEKAGAQLFRVGRDGQLSVSCIYTGDDVIPEAHGH